MKLTLQDRLLGRELGERSRYTSIAGFYGDKTWIDDLDIVNELGGHSGCVNALSWSKSGRLLASGSDDLHLNIHQYQPEESTAPFALTTTVSTGHTANIFSVKFMPHSNDRTVVTAAGDAEVRVFDIEYSGRSRIAPAPPSPSSSSRSRGLNNLYNGVRYLSDGDTNARIYRSHSDRVKRIVTENSPYLFLTCSEDGEVRQWDTRQPSSYYPAPSSSLRRSLSRTARSSDNVNVPPPLISYKRYHLDINTISCSPYQPHYIALGGAHLHCFLHDRRMSGRDLLGERGQPGVPSSSESSSSRDNDILNTATRCVRKFAPNGVKKMGKMDNGHITACKISDANPNEMVVSWSGEWIYSFNLIHSPDANETQSRSQTIKKGKGKGKAKESADRRDRKRKRGQIGSSSSPEEDGRETPKPRDDASDSGDFALRVRYENGQSEDIRIEPPSQPIDPNASSLISEAREANLTEPQRRSYRVAQAVVNLRKEIFGLKSSIEGPNLPESTNELTLHTASFAAGLGHAAAYLPVMDEIIRAWRYPVNPTEEDVAFQSTLRKHRETARRFVQAAGTLARALGGTIRTASRGPSPRIWQFQQIEPDERNALTVSEEFCYDFLKAILLWLEGGVRGLCQGFKPPVTAHRHISRTPIPLDAREEAVQDMLIPHLMRLAGQRHIPNVDASRFERDEYLLAFKSEKAAVTAFSKAIEIPFQTGESSKAAASASVEVPVPAAEGVQVQDKRAATRFWGFKVGRGLLMNAAEGVNFAYVDRAFGGLGLSSTEDETAREGIVLAEDGNDDLVIADINVVSQETSSRPPGSGDNEANANSTPGDHVQSTETSTRDSPPPYSSRAATARSPSEEELFLQDLGDEFEVRIGIGNNEEEEEDDDDDDDDDDDGDDDDDADADSGEEDSDGGDSDRGHLVWASVFDQSGMRSKVGRDVPCSSHTRQYRGHCNVKTVKDVNFFGLQDEYVVSGSDSGHVFIWNKKTSELVSILEGDGEVVNVVQGHPYEPMLAVSGIDHTIKIFSSDQQAQEDARNGVNICHRGDSGWSSLEYGIMHRNRPRRSTSLTNPPEDGTAPHGLASCKRMSDSYAITSKNDVERQGGNRDAFLTRGMVATLISRLRDRQAGGGAGLPLMLLRDL